MKYKILVVSIISFIISNAISINLDAFFMNTFYTVSGIMFSIGMSIAVTSNTSIVVNKSIRKNIREEIDRIRDLFISCFAVDACIYVLNIIFENWTLKVYDYKIFDLSIFQLIIQLYSIAYFVVNFKSLQNLNNQIGDAIND